MLSPTIQSFSLNQWEEQNKGGVGVHSPELLCWQRHGSTLAPKQNFFQDSSDFGKRLCLKKLQS